MTADSRDNSRWSTPETVRGFSQAAPNPVLMAVADVERRRHAQPRALDLGCGAGRNAIPLAQQGWIVAGIDLSSPMLVAAAARAGDDGVAGRVQLARASMDRLPAPDSAFDLVIAHGIWNLAGSAREFRAATREAARIAKPGAALFVFTFSRNTLAAGARPVDGETFVFTQFSGQPQVFLTEAELIDEMAQAGFARDANAPLTEYNRRPAGTLRAGGPPVIYEGVFHRVS